MPYKWETKFKTLDKVKIISETDNNGIVGTILEICIHEADSDIDYWKKICPIQDDRKNHPISYPVWVKDKDGCQSSNHQVMEEGLELVNPS